MPDLIFPKAIDEKLTRARIEMGEIVERADGQDLSGDDAERFAELNKETLDLERQRLEAQRAEDGYFGGDVRVDNLPKGTVIRSPGFQSYHVHGDDHEETGLLRRSDSMVDHVRSGGGDWRSYDKLTLGSLVRGMFTRGRKPEVIQRALSEGTDSAGGYAVPTILSAKWIDALRAQSVVFQAGAQTFPIDTNVTNLAKIASDPTPEWLGEAAASTFSDPVLTRVQFDARTCRVLFKASRELVEDAPNFDALIQRTVTGAFATAIDTAALVGSTGSTAPLGLLSSTDITVDAVNAGTEIVGNSTVWSKFTNYDPVVAAYKLIISDNAPEPNAAVLHSVDYTRLMGRGKDSQNQPLRKPPLLENMDFYYSNNLPSTGAVTYGAVEGSSADATQAVVGFFPDLVVGVRSPLVLMPLHERYVDTNEIGFFAVGRWDVNWLHHQSFASIDHLSETGTT